MRQKLILIAVFVFLFINKIYAQAQKNIESKDKKGVITKTLPKKKSPPIIKVKKPPIESSQNLEILYGSSPWNIDSTRIDSAELFVKDSKTGRVLKILLEETEPDSSTFKGNFSFGWTKDEDINLEVYIPPENIRGKEAQLNKFIGKIREGKVGRKPVVYKKDKDNKQIVDVYDTKDQAEMAYRAYLEKVKQEDAQKNFTQPPVAVVKQADKEAAALAARQAKLAELAVLAASREEQRIRREQLEKQKTEERLRLQKELQEAEKRKLKEQARKFAEEAIEAYKQGDFLKAENLFKKSIEFDPSETSYYFRYGVSLYRNEKFEEALTTLKLAVVDETTDIEKNYYLGLIHFRLKELDPALAKFTQVKNARHEIMSPSAAFYEGVILYTNEKFETSKDSFEYVLDNSKDPKLDEVAEEYIERIANAIAFKKKQSHRHDFTLTLGTTYDSNILFYPDNQSSQGLATDIGGMRMLETFNYQYRAIYQREFDWTLSLTHLYLYSFDNALQTADPMIMNVKSPLNWKGVMWGKGYKFSASPGYEFFYMDTVEGEGKNPPATNILRSALLDLELTLIMRDNWFSTYIIENRLDDSRLDLTSVDDDADATLTTFRTNQTFFLDKAKKRAVQAGGGYTLNNAKGDNRLYNKYLVNFSYSQPFQKWKDASWNTRLDLFHLDFYKSNTNRSDTNYSLTYALSKAQNTWMVWGASLNYTVNNSIQANQYTKYSALFTVTFDIDEWILNSQKNQ